jgi:hypothetical protein
MLLTSVQKYLVTVFFSQLEVSARYLIVVANTG